MIIALGRRKVVSGSGSGGRSSATAGSERQARHSGHMTRTVVALALGLLCSAVPRTAAVCDSSFCHDNCGRCSVDRIVAVLREEPGRERPGCTSSCTLPLCASCTVERIVQMMMDRPDDSTTQESGCEALMLLAPDSGGVPNKQAINHAGGAQAVVAAMRNTLLQSDIGVQSQCLHALGRLAAANEDNRQAFAGDDGVELVLDAMRAEQNMTTFPDENVLQGDGCRALGELVADQSRGICGEDCPPDVYSQDLVRREQGIAVVRTALHVLQTAVNDTGGLADCCFALARLAKDNPENKAAICADEGEAAMHSAERELKRRNFWDTPDGQDYSAHWCGVAREEACEAFRPLAHPLDYLDGVLQRAGCGEHCIDIFCVIFAACVLSPCLETYRKNSLIRSCCCGKREENEHDEEDGKPLMDQGAEEDSGDPGPASGVSRQSAQNGEATPAANTSQIQPEPGPHHPLQKSLTLHNILGQTRAAGGYDELHCIAITLRISCTSTWPRCEPSLRPQWDLCQSTRYP